MPLYDSPEHSADLYTSTSSRDSAGGTNLTYTPAQSGVPCSVNLLSSREVERYAQQGIVASHCCAFLGDALTVTPVRGMKLVVGGLSFHVRGIRAGLGYGGIPRLTYLDCEQVLG